MESFLVLLLLLLPVLSTCDSDFLPPLRAAEYRSLVGIAVYLAQERFDLQYPTKTLASCLQPPTRAAWSALGRLVGYLRFSEDFGLFHVLVHGCFMGTLFII